MSRAEVRTDVAIAWYDRLYAWRTEQLLQGLADEIAMQQRATEAQVSSGKASAADVLTTRAMLVQARDRVLTAHRQQQAATAKLARWLGEDASRPPVDDAALPSDAEVATLPEHDLHNIPHLRVLAGQADVADAEVKVAEQNRSPNWSWEVSYAQRGPAYSNMISVGVSVPLPIARGDRQDRELAARLAQRDQARELLEDARRRHRSEFSAMRIEWQALRERQRQLESALLPVTRQRIEAVLAAYGSGQQNLSAVLEARRAEVDARIQILELERDAARVWAQLRHTYLESAGAKP
jgi:outer membrane protein TolC